LLVDDDADVHESTAYALRGLEIAGRPLQLLHARSAAEALALLRHDRHVAVILLDVVMETEHAGLDLVAQIRGDLGLVHTRIVLRTGQPGQAPELETIRRYDINDYKTKAELTRNKLYVTLTAAIRAYDQLCRLEASRRGLEKVVAASNAFIAEQGMVGFAEGVILQIAGLLGVDAEGVVCACMTPALPHQPAASAEEFRVIAAAGRWRHLIQRRLGELQDAQVRDSLLACLRQRHSHSGEGFVTLYFPGRGQQDFAAYIAARTPLPEIDQQLLEVFCTNITLCASNVALVARLREHAYVDPLLGIPNRTALLELLDSRIAAQSLGGQVLATLDIDQFAETNDLFGHRFGDQLLQALSRRLVQGLSPDCVVARVGGNAFAVLGAEARVQPEALRALVDEPLQVDQVARRVSVGISLVRCDDARPRDGSELLKDAALALKRAKAGGPGQCVTFTRALGTESKERMRLLHGLQRAFEHDRLFLAYQPQLSLDGDRVIGLEALLRWRAEDGQMVPPDRFIPLAEQSGLIVALGQWCLRSALDALATIDRSGHAPLRVAVNVSAVQFAHPEFLAQFDQALADKGIAPQRLELEITESVAVLGLERVAALLAAIRRRGVGVAIDDFGTGFSSLSYLDQLPADRLKIDRSFVSRLDSDRPGARIARMIVPLGHQLGMRVIAEGVETAGQLQALREMGCDEAQGYLFARPMALPELLAWLEQRAPASRP
jgi:diguanylate cyclase (GGDEF)-like protein